MIDKDVYLIGKAVAEFSGDIGMKIEHTQDSSLIEIVKKEFIEAAEKITKLGHCGYLPNLEKSKHTSIYEEKLLIKSIQETKYKDGMRGKKNEIAVAYTSTYYRKNDGEGGIIVLENLKITHNNDEVYIFKNEPVMREGMHFFLINNPDGVITKCASYLKRENQAEADHISKSDSWDPSRLTTQGVVFVYRLEYDTYKHTKVIFEKIRPFLETNNR